MTANATEAAGGGVGVDDRDGVGVGIEDGGVGAGVEAAGVDAADVGATGGVVTGADVQAGTRRHKAAICSRAVAGR